jgi:phage shock protein C
MSKKRLERNEEKAVVAGVVTGLADYFEQDPILFRLVAIIFLVLTGIFPGLLVYIIAWVMIPRKGRIHEAQDVEYEVVD